MLSPQMVELAKEVLYKHNLVCMKKAAVLEDAKTNSHLMKRDQAQIPASRPATFVSEVMFTPQVIPDSSIQCKNCWEASDNELDDSVLYKAALHKHRKGLCKPCYFHHWGACARGVECFFCHFHHGKEDFKQVKLSKKGRKLLEEVRLEKLLKCDEDQTGSPRSSSVQSFQGEVGLIGQLEYYQ